MISIHVREKSEMERGRVGVWGGGGQNSEPILPDILVGTFFQNNAFYVLFPPPLPSQIVK